MRSLLIAALLAGLFFPFTAALCDDGSVDLSKIVVTPSRIEQSEENAPYNVNVISGKELRSADPASLEGALEDLTSATITSNGGLGQTSSIRMRGASASEVLVMMDGRPLNSPRDGEVDLSTIPMSQIDRIEVVHGPGSSLYGSSAVGGVVNILSKNPPKKPTTQVTSLAGNHETFIERASHGATIGRFGYIVNAEYDHTDGFRQNSATDQNSASTKLTYAPNDDNKLSLNTGYFNSRLGTPGMKSMPDNDDRQLDYKNFVDGSWAFDAGEGLSFLNRGYRNYEKLRFFENTAGSMWDIAGDTFRHTTVSNGFDSQVTKEFNDVYTVTGGFNYVGNFNNSTTSGKHSYNVRAGYLQNILKVTERTTLQVGGRVDDYSNFGTQFDPNAGVIYAFNKTDRLRASVSRSFRAPTFNELFWPDQGWAKGNPNLRPEKSVNMDAGFDKKVTERWSASVTYFHNRFRDLINWVTDSSWVSQPVNIGSAQIDGIEFGSKVTLTEKLKFLLDYTYQRPIDRQTRKDLVYEPRHKLNSTLKYEVAGATVRLNGVYSNTRFVNADNTMKAKQYFVLNLGLTKALSPNVDFLLNLNNLLNRKYEVVKEFPEPGFTVLTGVKATF